MYLLADASEVEVRVLRVRLDSLGDSVLVVGEAGLWNVHAHVDDVGAAIEAGLVAGRPHRIAVTHFGDQRHGRTRGGQPAAGVSVVACAAGEGLADLFRRGGATVVDSAPGRRASTGSLLRAIEQAGTAIVLVLPNDLDTRLAAEAAASVAAEDGIGVEVLRAVAAVQGMAALAVYDPQADPVLSAAAMNQAADATRHGSITVASRAARTPAGPCRPGDVLGVVDGAVSVVGSDLALVAAQVLRAMLREGGELVTLVTGLDAPPGLGEVVASELPHVEVTVVVGGQPTYPLLIGVE